MPSTRASRWRRHRRGCKLLAVGSVWRGEERWAGQRGRKGGRAGCGVEGAFGGGGGAGAGEGSVSVWPRRRWRSAGDRGRTAEGRQGTSGDRLRFQAQVSS